MRLHNNKTNIVLYRLCVKVQSQWKRTLRACCSNHLLRACAPFKELRFLPKTGPIVLFKFFRNYTYLKIALELRLRSFPSIVSTFFFLSTFSASNSEMIRKVVFFLLFLSVHRLTKLPSLQARLFSFYFSPILRYPIETFFHLLALRYGNVTFANFLCRVDRHARQRYNLKHK